LQYEIDPNGPNILIEERNNTVTMLRNVAWNGRDARLELRKWVVEENGEKPMRGLSFLTPEGPNNLVNALTEQGYGNTQTIIKNIKGREGFEDALAAEIGMQKVIEAKNTEVTVQSDEFYDPKSMLGIG
jgi:hypothetical protein